MSFEVGIDVQLPLFLMSGDSYMGTRVNGIEDYIVSIIINAGLLPN